MYRSHLVLLFMVLLAAALLVASIPFFLSLSPSERSVAALPRVKVPTLLPGQFAFVDDPFATDQWPSRLMMLRQKTGELFVWSIPTYKGVMAMPDNHWWRADIPCPSFGPDFSSEVIACSDPNLHSSRREAFRWHLDGKNISGHVDDMPQVHGEERDGEFVYSMRRG